MSKHKGITSYIAGRNKNNGGVIIDATNLFEEAVKAREAGLVKSVDGRWFATPSGLQLLREERGEEA